MLDYIDWVFDYDKEQGKLYRRSKRSPSCYWECGTEAITRGDRELGNVVILTAVKVRGKAYSFSVATIAWYISYRLWPHLVVDHIDGNSYNNRLSNFRLATDAQSNQNRRCRNQTGFYGVFKWVSTSYKVYYVGRVRISGKAYKSKYHSTAYAAALERDEIILKLRDEWSVLNILQRTNEFIEA